MKLEVYDGHCTLNCCNALIGRSRICHVGCAISMSCATQSPNQHERTHICTTDMMFAYAPQVTILVVRDLAIDVCALLAAGRRAMVHDHLVLLGPVCRYFGALPLEERAIELQRDQWLNPARCFDSRLFLGTTPPTGASTRSMIGTRLPFNCLLT